MFVPMKLQYCVEDGTFVVWLSLLMHWSDASVLNFLYGSLAWFDFLHLRLVKVFQPGARLPPPVNNHVHRTQIGGHFQVYKVVS